MNTSRWLLRVLLLALAFMAGTAAFGWWSLPVLALVWGIIARGTVKPALTAGLAATLGWGILLGWASATGPVALLTTKLGGIAGMPGVTFVGLTLLLPFVLAVTAARLARR